MPIKNPNNKAKVDLRGKVLPDTIAYLDKLGKRYGLSRLNSVDIVCREHEADAEAVAIFKRLLFTGQLTLVWKTQKPPQEIINWVKSQQLDA